jgi:hypothetical protein
MKILLKIKHWQLFLILFGLPFGFQIIFISSMIGGHSDFLFNYFIFFPFLMVLYIAIFFGWFWSIAVGLQYKVPADVKMKVGRFKIFFFTPLIYILFIVGFMFIGFGTGHQPHPGIFALIVPLHLFSMFCMFHNLYFVSKTIKTIELQREVIFSDFAGEFFLIWFFPIGIWFIQPKLNKFAEND